MKKLRVLIVGQPNGWFQTRAKEEAKSYGIEIDSCWSSALVSTHDASGTTVTVNGKNVFDYDLIHFFTVQESRSLWYAVGALAAKKGIQIVDQNCLDTLVSEQSILFKLATESEVDLPFPTTTIVSSFKEAMKTLREAKRPIVVKTLNSRKGHGVALLRNAFDLFAFSIKQRKHRSFAFREYIDADGDYRVNVVDGKAYVAVIRRGQNGEWRNNISLGGVGENVPLKKVPHLVTLAEKAAKTFGFDVAGVDIIVSKQGDPYILEINRSPEMDTFEELSGVNLVGKVVEMYLKKCGRT